MKTVLFGLKMDTNLGDYLIGYNLQKILSDRFPDDVFAYEDLKGRENDSKIKTNFIACVLIKLSSMLKSSSLCNVLEKAAFYQNNRRIKRFYKNILKDANTVVFAGGGLIECEHYGCHQYIHLITKICEQQGINIIYNAVGFNGEYKDTNGYRVLKECLNSKFVKAVSVRENIEELRKYTNCSATLVCDPACYCSRTYDESGDVEPRKKEGRKEGRNRAYSTRYLSRI